MVCEIYEISFRCMKSEYPEDFEQIDWKNVSGYRFLSVEFIEEFKDYLDWGTLITYQPMSEEFIRKHIKYINWKALTNRYLSKLSIEFIIEYYHMLDKKIMERQHIDEVYSGKRLISYDLTSNNKYKNHIKSTSIDDLTLFMYTKKDFELTGYSKEVY